jgi:flagellar protein FlaG
MLIQKVQGFAPGAAPTPVVRSAPARAGAELAAVGTRPLVEVKAAPAAVEPPPTAAETKAAVVQANRAMAALSASLSFEVDVETRTTVVKVIDTSDNSVLRQIPSKEMLEIARALDRLQGMLVRDKA